MSKSNVKRQPKVLEDLTQKVESAPVIAVPQTVVSDGERKNVIEMSMVEWDDICSSKGLKTKSAMIRYLWSANYTRSAIAKFLGIIYQHVRNVLIQVPKKPTTGATQNTAADAASAEGSTTDSE